MKRTTKDRIVLFIFYGVASLGIASIIYGIEMYFFEKADPLTPYGIWAYGFVMIIAACIGITIQTQRKRK